MMKRLVVRKESHLVFGVLFDILFIGFTVLIAFSKPETQVDVPG